MDKQVNTHKGLNDLLARPLLETMWRRRTHRVPRGVEEVAAGSMTYKSEQDPKPLSELEEAVLIATTGATGLTMPDSAVPGTRTPAALLWRSPT